MRCGRCGLQRHVDFHAGLYDQSSGQYRESKPWTWPMGLRPTLYYYASGEQGHGLRHRRLRQRAVMLIGTPALWWPAIPVLAWGLWRGR